MPFLCPPSSFPSFPNPPDQQQLPSTATTSILGLFKMRELRDQLCTLLITFRDDQDPNKEITAAHTFSSIKPEDYPQRRRVVHTRHADYDSFGRGHLLSTTERLSQSSVSAAHGRLGSDMVEHRRVLSSPPFVASASPNSLLQPEKPGSAMSGEQQLRHTNTTGSVVALSGGSSMISIHEVSLTYTRSLDDSPPPPAGRPFRHSTATDRHWMPSASSLSTAPQQHYPPAPLTTTTFPSAGSVHVHLGGPLNKGGGGRDGRELLPYSVSRPQAEWTFHRAGEQVQGDKAEKQISHQPSMAEAPPPPTKMRAMPLGGEQQQKTHLSLEQSTTALRAGKIEMIGGRGGQQGQQQQQRQPQQQTGLERSPKMPVRPPPPVHPPASGLPVLSHRQSRSFESSEQSSMMKQREKGKSRTLFQKTTCEMLTEKSVIKFGAKTEGGGRQIPVKQSAAEIPQKIAVQQRGLPRYQHGADWEKGAHLYTTYDPNGQHQRGQQGQRQKLDRKRGGGEIISLEERLEEEYHQRTVIGRHPHPPAPPPPPPPKSIPLGPLAEPIIQQPFEPRAEGGEQQARLIDFETYKREVEQLQKQAAAQGMARPMERPIPLSPAVVLPRKLPRAPEQPNVETTMKYFAREELWQRTGRQKAPDEVKVPTEEELRRRRKQAEEEEERRREEEKIRRKLEEEEEERSRRRRQLEQEEMAMREAAREEQRRRAEEEAAAAAKRRKRRPKLMVATTAEVYQETIEEVISRFAAAPPSAAGGPLPPQPVQRRSSQQMATAKLEEKVQLVSSGPIRMLERAEPVIVAREERAEEMPTRLMPKEEAMEETKEEELEGPSEAPQVESPPVDYELELDTSDMGKRLFEQLRRELQYEEEIDTEVRRRRRQKEGGGEEEEADEEEPEEPEEIGTEPTTERMEESEGRRMPSTEEEEEEGEEVESEDVPMPTEEATPLWRDHWDAATSGILSPPRHAVKVSMSGELPPLMEEEEEPSFEEKVEVVETSTSQVQTRKKQPPPPPPPPPPKPPLSTHFPSSERRRDPSWSSAYSYQYPTSPAYTSMEYSPASSDYRSAISARQHYQRPMRPLSPIQSSLGGGHRVLKMVSETSSISSRPMSPYPGGSTAASAVRDSREREKKQMSDLNDRLANYIEKVRFLEAQNRKLATDLDFLRNRWGRDAANVREMFEADLKQAKKLIEESDRQREELERKARAMAEDMAQLKRKNDDGLVAHEEDKERMEELLLKLAALESEMAALKRRLAILEEDVKSLKRENARLGNEVQRARTELDQETLNRIDYQNQVQTLLEEIDFLRRAHDQEIQDLQAMASRDTTQENREMFRNELASAMRDIREDYERINNRNRTDIESWYKLKVQEIQTHSTRQNLEQNYAKEEVKRLRTQLGDLRGKLADLEGKNSLLEKQAEELAYQLEDDQRAYESALNERDAQIRRMREECQALMLELQMLLDTKQTLDAEIAIYRRMLEGEEDRAGLRQLVEQVVRTHKIQQSDETESTRVLRGEKSSRQSYQRSAKGNVSILEASPDGKYIVLENTHRSKEEAIGEWKLKRRIDGKREILFTFPRDFVLRPGKTVKIWARNQGGIQMPPEQLIFEGEESFGVGSNVQTMLYNREGEERASLIQRSSAQMGSRQQPQSQPE